MSRNRGGTMVANLFAKFGADTEEYQKKMRAVVTRMLFAAESFTQAGRIMTAGITVPMALIGAAAIRTAMQFDTAMTRIVSLVGMSAETIDRWRPVVQKMAGEVGKSATELAEALFFITSNGIRTDAALQVLKSSAQAAAVGLGETKDVAFAATSAMNAYGEGALSAEEAVAVLIGTVREGNLEAATLPAALGRLLPIAAAMGIEFHEAGAGIAQMTRSGTSARLAAFGLRSVMMSLLAPTTSARKAAKSMELNFKDLRREAEDNLLGALLHIKDATEAHGRSLKSILPNNRAYTAALQLLGENVEQTKTTFESMAKVVGSDVAKAFAIVSKTPQQKLNEALAKLSSAAIDLGQNLTPLLEHFGDFAEFTAKAARGFNNLNDGVKDFSITLGLALMGTGPLLYGLGSLARMSARFTGLSILFKAAWVQKVAAMMMGEAAALKVATNFDLMGVSVAKAGLGLATAAVAGWKFGQWIDETFGITQSLNEEFGRLGTAIDSTADALAASEEDFYNAAGAAMGLVRAMKNVRLERELGNAMYNKDAKEVSRLIALIDEEANAYNRLKIKVEGKTAAQDEEARKNKIIADAKAEALRTEKELFDAERKRQDLLTAPEVKALMEETLAFYDKSIEKGIARNRVNEAMVDDVAKILQWQKDYNIAAPKGVREMAESMMKQGIPAAEKFGELMEQSSSHIDATPGKVIRGMVMVGDKIATTLAGGFERGFAAGQTKNSEFNAALETHLGAALRGGFTDGFSAFRDEIGKIVQEFENTPLLLRMAPDPDFFMRVWNDLQEGRYPDLGG